MHPKPEYLAHRVTSNAASTNSRHPHRWTITTEHISAFKGEQTTSWPCQHDMLDHAYGQCKCCAKLCTPMSIRDVQLAHAVLAGGIFECLVANVHAFANGWPSLQPHHAVLSQYPAHKLQPLETVWATQKGQCSRPWSHSSQLSVTLPPHNPVQPGQQGCVMHATGGQTRCWKHQGAEIRFLRTCSWVPYWDKVGMARCTEACGTRLLLLSRYRGFFPMHILTSPKRGAECVTIRQV